MANAKTDKSRRRAWLGLLAASAVALTLTSVSVTTAQQPDGGRPPIDTKPRARTLLRSGQDRYKSGDYETATMLFTQAQAHQSELTATEKNDLKTFTKLNADALAGQKQGSLQLRQADEALRVGKTADAARLVKGLTANPYLSVPDRQKLVTLQVRLQTPGRANGPPANTAALKPWEKGVENNEKALLAAAREALKQGELDAAEALAASAEKVAPFVHPPFADTPARVRRDIAAARAKMPGAAHGDKKESGGFLPSVRRLWPGSSTEKKEDSSTGVRADTAPPPLIRNENRGTPTSAGKQSQGTVVSQSNFPPASAANKELARKLIKDGYKALDKGDYETARRLAMQAKDLHPDLEWYEENPARLLDDIQRRAPKTGTPATKSPPPSAPTGKISTGTGAGAKAAGKPPVVADAHVLVRQARTLLKQEKFDEADKLCAQAAAARPNGWGLFEDSPAKLRTDINKARSKQLLVEARKLYAKGNLAEAKQKALIAQKLHGPYTIWDMGDRPQSLLEAIQRAEAKTPTPSTAIAKNTDFKKQPTTPLVSGTAQASAKIRAVALLQEARELKQKGLLVEARARAVQAEQLHVAFGPEEDSPATVLLALAAQCERTVDQLLQRAGDEMQSHPGDLNRMKKAQTDIDAARTLARAFRLDGQRIEQKAQWLQQAIASSGVRPSALPPRTLPAGLVHDQVSEPPTIVQVGAVVPAPQSADSSAERNHLLGREKLDRARLELRAGNLSLARRLAEDAVNPQYGIQEEAAAVLRSIDADEHNHQVNLALRNADAGIDAYNRRDFRQAASICQGIDMRLLPADKARRIGEIMATAQMQPQNVQLVDTRVVIPVVAPNNPGVAAPGAAPPGLATATDLPVGDDLTKTYRAMEEIQFQQMRDRSMSVQKSAMDLFKAGRKAQAVDTLKDYLDELANSQLDPQRLALIKVPVEKRMQQYRTVLAQDALDKQADGVTTNWKEGQRTKAIAKTQEDVAEQLRLYRVFQKEGKYKEALAAARKAKELDPDNLSADAAIEIAKIKMAQEDYAKGQQQNEEFMLKGLNPGNGPYVDMEGPVTFDAERLKRAQARKNGENGFSTQSRDPIERSIERKLSEPVSVIFKDAPLSQVISDLNVMVQGANIIADRAALAEAGVSLDMPLNLSIEKVSLKSALNILLDQLKLTYHIKNQALQITTKEKASGQRYSTTYGVADLVVPVENHGPGMADMNAALSQTLARASGMVNNGGVSPWTTAYSLQNGAPVSSPGSGVSTSFATSGGTGAPTSLVQPRPTGQTIEDLLIDLIKKTVKPDSWSDVGGPGTIQYFPLGMALVVNQTQEVQEDVAALLQSLRRLQDLEVAIEMRLVSVSESFFERIGVDFDVNFKGNVSPRNQVDLINGQFTPFGQVNGTFQGTKALTGLTPAGTLTPDLGIPIRNSSFDFTVPPFGGYPGTIGADGGLGLGLAFLSDIQVFMFLEAAQGDRRMNIMQAPKITVFNGQTANISINDFQFFLTGLTISAAGGQLIYTPNNQPFPLGVTMTVTPVVSADRRFVRLNLTPSLTNLANANVPLIPIQIPVPQLFEGPGQSTTVLGQPVIFQMFFQQPTLTSITVNTTVNVPDGGTVLLGGLKTMSEGRNEFGPPILSKIPYLSRLFKNVAYGRDGQSLMIMVTPRIIINEEEEGIYTGTINPIPRP